MTRTRLALLFGGGLTAALAFLPEPALADNCSSLRDCWNTMEAAATTAVAAAATVIVAVAGVFSRDIYDEIVDDIWNWVRAKVPMGPAYGEALKRSKEAAEAARDQIPVFEEIADAVGEGLSTGVLPPQTDGGLGQTHDNWTPDGDVPFDIGTVPGISSPGAGVDRSAPASPGGDSGVGAPSGAGGGPTPLGDPSRSGGADAGAPAGSSPPTPEDLGIDPESGDWYQYYPEWGIVDVYNADGSLRETLAWPPQ